MGHDIYPPSLVFILKRDSLNLKSFLFFQLRGHAIQSGIQESGYIPSASYIISPNKFLQWDLAAILLMMSEAKYTPSPSSTGSAAITAVKIDCHSSKYKGAMIYYYEEIPELAHRSEAV